MGENCRDVAGLGDEDSRGCSERLLFCRVCYFSSNLISSLSFRPGAKLGWNLGSLWSMCLKALSLGDSVNLRHSDSKVGSPDELGSCFLWVLRTGSGPGDDRATAATPSGWWCLELRVTTESWPSGWIRAHLCKGAGLARGCLSSSHSLQVFPVGTHFHKYCLSTVCHHPASVHSREWAENLARSTVHYQVVSPGSPLV